jgi:hypothetical protein
MIHRQMPPRRHRRLLPWMLAAVACLAGASIAWADASVRGFAEFKNPPPGANDFHIDYHSNLGKFTAKPRAKDDTGTAWGQQTAGGDGTGNTASTTFKKPKNSPAFTTLFVTIQIAGPTLCDMHIDDKYWTKNGQRLPKKVAGPSFCVDFDPSGNSRFNFIDEHADVSMRLTEVSLDIFSSDDLPPIDGDFATEPPYTFSMPDFTLDPGQRVSFVYPRAAADDEFTSARALVEVLNPDTGAFELEGSWRVQHAVDVPQPAAYVLLAAGTLALLARRRRR